MQDSKPTIIRKYQRRSRSPFEGDDSTILLLANVSAEPTGVVLDYQRYIYLHRDNVGKWLGISISNSLEQEMDDGGGKYRQGKEALSLLLSYHQEISDFLKHFSDDIESVFGIDAETWMLACKARWRKKLL
tara:strand:+ start:2078 stop:2470 length:393 start_codon:yes stop_codon:yes gene_type:complete